MVRQPYSVAVPSTGGRLHPLVPEGFCPPELGEPKGCKDHWKRGLVRKVELPLAKDFANERNESLLSNCRVQLILSKGRRRDSKNLLEF